MAITTIAGYLTKNRETINLIKSGTLTTVAGFSFSTFAMAGSPAAGTLAGTDAVSGVLQTPSLIGYPAIPIASPVGSIRITKATYAYSQSATAQMTYFIYDTIWKAGSYAYNANQALSSHPDISGRVPGADYSALELWFCANTAFTGNPTVTITYTNQAGTGSRTATLAPGVAPTVARMFRIALQEGDTGIQKVDNVVGTVASAGDFDILLMRRVGTVTFDDSGYPEVHNIVSTGMPVIYPTSALQAVVFASGTSANAVLIQLEIVDDN